MTSVHVDVEKAEWTSGTAFCGPAAIHDGKEIVQVKRLSDRRSEGGGSAWLVKLIKIVATAMSDEHVFNLEGGRATKSGEPARASGGYSLNPKGQPHSALIGSETIAFVVYSGELDRIELMEVIDAAPPAS
jgi:hypothetical protein